MVAALGGKGRIQGSSYTTDDDEPGVVKGGVRRTEALRTTDAGDVNRAPVRPRISSLIISLIKLFVSRVIKKNRLNES